MLGSTKRCIVCVAGVDGLELTKAFQFGFGDFGVLLLGDDRISHTCFFGCLCCLFVCLFGWLFGLFVAK